MARDGMRTAAAVLLCLVLTACAPGGDRTQTDPVREGVDTGRFLTFVDDDPDTVDPQCTSEYYTVALNVFDRLVEIQPGPDGTSAIVPSLARAWEVSDDGLTYTFHLEQGVRFSNGALLTASDVLYTLTRLLTYPGAVNQDIAAGILGAEELQSGRSGILEGFQSLSDYDFSITLERPYAAFLACLSTPGASILDEETTREAGELFGRDAAHTIGTGPFLLREWRPGEEILLAANADCWSGPPRCDGLALELLSDPEAQRLLFEQGRLDILDLDTMGSEAEYFVHGDIYQDQLRQGPRVGIAYIALNESVEPLDDVRVRRALQLSLDRQTLLDAVYSGRGAVEHGIFPHGLIGFDSDLPPIPYDPEEASRLLREAGQGDGFPLEISVPAGSSQNMMELLGLTAAMWSRIGVDARIVVRDEEEHMALRRSGSLACYSNTWSADYNDPDNFIYTFFGTWDNTFSRSLCYADEAVMQRVRAARAIVDEEDRIREYQALQRKIIQEDAAWIPLFSKQHYFVVSERVDGFQVSWNGWSSNSYRDVAVR